MDNFQQTVDLRKKTEKPKPSAEALEEIYAAEETGKLKKISRPIAKETRLGLIRLIVFIVALSMVGAAVYYLFFRAGGEDGAAKNKNWYAVKLVDGEIYYGQIADVKADPVVINNAYYNYDQAKDQAKPTPETGNLRLVKRGQETHGPDGSMNVVRAQVLFMEPLKADSKVLKAILSYEK